MLCNLQTMVKFKLEGKEYTLPEFINIEQYVKIAKLKDLLSDDYYAAKLISIMSNAPVQELLESDYDHVNYLAAYILNLIPKQIPEFQDKFELDGVKYGFFPRWQDLSYAEFVDMDTIVTRKEDEMLNMLHILAAVMFRPIVSELSEHNFEIEKYDVKTMVKRAELFKEKLNVRYVLGAQSFFFKIREEIFSLYPSIFDTEDYDMDENEAALEMEKALSESSFQQAFGWFVVTNRLAGNDFTKHDYIYQKTVNEVLNQLSFLISYDKEQIRLQKEAQRGF